MGTQAKTAGKLSKNIGKVIQGILDERGVSQNQLSLESGVSQPRVNRGISGKSPIYIDELDAYSEALGIRTSSILQQAERLSESVVAEQNSENANSPETIPEHATQAYIDEAQALARQAIANGYALAAKHHEPNPYDAIGEENQDHD